MIEKAVLIWSPAVAMSNVKMVFASMVLAAVPSVAAAQSGAEIGVRTGYAFAAGLRERWRIRTTRI